MIAYRFTIEGEITASSAAKAYAALTEVLAEVTESLDLHATGAELKDEIRVTLAPMGQAYE